MFSFECCLRVILIFTSADTAHVLVLFLAVALFDNRLTHSSCHSDSSAPVKVILP